MIMMKMVLSDVGCSGKECGGVSFGGILVVLV